MAVGDCAAGIPEEVAAQPAARVPTFDPTLGIAVAPDRTGEPPHRLVAVGDSLTHGFQSGAIHNTHLSYPALIARELGIYERFQHPSYDRYGGLPVNIEYLLHDLEARFGTELSPWELPIAGWRLRDLMDEIEDYWEHDEQQPQRFGSRNHNLGIYGWDVYDANARSAADCRRDIAAPTDALLKQVVQNANERAALRVLASGPAGQEELSPLETAVALGADGTPETPGIETLIVMLGANNALGTVTELRTCWSACSSYEDPVAKRRYTVWDPAHFREELAHAVGTTRRVRARHVIWSTIPHVTIAPVARGIGGKVTPGSRYFRFYARPWVTDAAFHPGHDRHLTAAEARAIDTAIDLYNAAIEDAVRAAREDGLDWYLLDLCAQMDRLAFRRYDDMDAELRPPWWTPYPLPDALADLAPPPDSRFLRVDPQHGRTAGGLISLDGIHPTTIMYGLMAQEFMQVMQLAGVRFPNPGPDGAQIDFADLVRRDALISTPPRSLSGDLALIGWLDDKYGLFGRLLEKGP
jgi:hypothetical protein